MRVALKLLLVLLALGLGPISARATITCSSVTSSGFTWYYVNGTTVGVQLSYTLTCNRSSTSDPTSLAYSNNVNNGLHNDNAQLGGNNADRLAYNLYLGSCAGNLWKNKQPTNIDGTITWGASQTGTGTDTQYFWACINTGQTATASGWYTDTVSMNVKAPGGLNVSGSIPINIFAPSTCTVTSAPGTIAIDYTSFSTISKSGSTSFQTTCTSGMPFTMDVSPASGTLNGVDYTVAPSATASTGTGSVQNFSITATAISGQSGTCTASTCSQSQVTTLTITY